MGIKHLIEVENLFKKNPKDRISLHRIRTELNQNMKTALENVEYLLNKKFLAVNVREGSILYFLRERAGKRR